MPSAFTLITGTVSPPPSQASAPAIQSVNPTPPTNMLQPPGALPANFPAIAQSVNYTLDPAFFPSLKVRQVDFSTTLDTVAFFALDIGVAGFSADPTLGQPLGIDIFTLLGSGIAPGVGTTSIDTLGGLPAELFTSLTPGGSGSEVAGYVLPSSATLNPAGYTYQTFGSWSAIPGTLSTPIIEGFFSAGVPTTAAIPATGTALYVGQSGATFTDAVTGDQFETIAAVNVTVDFTARTVTMALAGTTTLASSANPGTSPTTNPALNFQGTLTYPVASNTFTGPGRTANAMSGNATGRFYGAPTGAATASKVAGSPPEIGGTFAVLLSGVGALQGAFGAR
jgi:hypothetical protein